jgi:hypothetical protein
MLPMLAVTRQNGVRLAEVGFLLILFAGVWLVAAESWTARQGTQGITDVTILGSAIHAYRQRRRR